MDGQIQYILKAANVLMPGFTITKPLLLNPTSDFVLNFYENLILSYYNNLNHITKYTYTLGTESDEKFDIEKIILIFSQLKSIFKDDAFCLPDLIMPTKARTICYFQLGLSLLANLNEKVSDLKDIFTSLSSEEREDKEITNKIEEWKSAIETKTEEYGAKLIEMENVKAEMEDKLKIYEQAKFNQIQENMQQAEFLREISTLEMNVKYKQEKLNETQKEYLDLTESIVTQEEYNKCKETISSLTAKITAQDEEELTFMIALEEKNSFLERLETLADIADSGDLTPLSELAAEKEQLVRKLAVLKTERTAKSKENDKLTLCKKQLLDEISSLQSTSISTEPIEKLQTICNDLNEKIKVAREEQITNEKLSKKFQKDIEAKQAEIEATKQCLQSCQQCDVLKNLCDAEQELHSKVNAVLKELLKKS